MREGVCGVTGVWVVLATACACGAASGQSAGAPGQPGAKQPPAAAPAPAQDVKSAVMELATAADKRKKIEELRRNYPLAPLADALAAAIESEPAFANIDVRTTAYWALAGVGEVRPGADGPVLVTDRQVDRLLAGLNEPTSAIRQSCAGALGRVPPARRESVVEPLVSVLADPTVGVSQQALLSLARLKLPRPAPAVVRETAFAPTAPMKARWAEAADPNAEASLREMAMGVIGAWEGLGSLADQDLSKDPVGRSARAVAIGRRLLKEPGGAGLDERQLGVVIAELAAVLREQTPVRDADRGAALTLGAVANKHASASVRTTAKDALQDALATAPEAKREIVREALARAR
jgi:hypothetical protein